MQPLPSSPLVVDWIPTDYSSSEDDSEVSSTDKTIQRLNKRTLLPSNSSEDEKPPKLPRPMTVNSSRVIRPPLPRLPDDIWATIIRLSLFNQGHFPAERLLGEYSEYTNSSLIQHVTRNVYYASDEFRELCKFRGVNKQLQSCSEKILNQDFENEPLWRKAYAKRYKYEYEKVRKNWFVLEAQIRDLANSCTALETIPNENMEAYERNKKKIESLAAQLLDGLKRVVPLVSTKHTSIEMDELLKKYYCLKINDIFAIINKTNKALTSLSREALSPRCFEVIFLDDFKELIFDYWIIEECTFYTLKVFKTSFQTIFKANSLVTCWNNGLSLEAVLKEIKSFVEIIKFESPQSVKSFKFITDYCGNSFTPDCLAKLLKIYLNPLNATVKHRLLEFISKYKCDCDCQEVRLFLRLTDGELCVSSHNELFNAMLKEMQSLWTLEISAKNRP